MPSNIREFAAIVLREVPNENAFYFYTDIDSPTGLYAKSLEEFIELLKKVEVKSIEFHEARGDFENWVLMLGDETLTKQLTKVRRDGLVSEPLRKRLLQILRLRLGLLKKSNPPNHVTSGSLGEESHHS